MCTAKIDMVRISLPKNLKHVIIFSKQRSLTQSSLLYTINTDIDITLQVLSSIRHFNTCISHEMSRMELYSMVTLMDVHLLVFCWENMYFISLDNFKRSAD